VGIDRTSVLLLFRKVLLLAIETFFDTTLWLAPEPRHGMKADLQESDTDQDDAIALM
jgi:hypothetical protein